MERRMESYKFLRVFILAIFLGFFFVSFTTMAQGTSVSVEGVKITEGDTTTLYITLKEALDGLGRFDAQIVSSKPEVVQLVSLSPEAVSEQFLQIDSAKKNAIKFKMVDLGKKIDPGDKNVKLLSLKVKALKKGTSKLTFEQVQYTDEDGNVIEPKITPGTITVQPSAPTEPTGKDEQKTEEKPEEQTTDKQDRQDSKTKGEKEEKTPVEKEEKVKKTEEKTKKDYVPELEGIELKLGNSGRLSLTTSPMPDGLRIAQVWVISSGGGLVHKGNSN